MLNVCLNNKMLFKLHITHSLNFTGSHFTGDIHSMNNVKTNLNFHIFIILSDPSSTEGFLFVTLHWKHVNGQKTHGLRQKSRSSWSYKAEVHVG